MAMSKRKFFMESKDTILKDLYSAKEAYANAIKIDYNLDKESIINIFSAHIDQGLCKFFCYSITIGFMEYVYKKSADEHWFPTPYEVYFDHEFSNKYAKYDDITIYIKKKCLMPRLKVVNNLIEKLKYFDNE